MSTGGNMRGLLQAGSMFAVGLWTVALVTPNWHVKTFYLGFMQYKAELKMNLFSYGWHCLSEPPTGDGMWAKFVRSFCGRPWMTDSQLTQLAAQMCAVEEQSMGIFKVGCDKVSIVAYTSMACLILISLSLLFTICGAVFMTMDPGGKPVAGMFLSAPIMQFICLACYIAVTYDLSDFYDTDKLTDGVGNVAGGVAGLIGGPVAGGIVNGVVDVAGKGVINDIDESITFGYSFFIAFGALVVSVVLAWCVWLNVDDIREREAWAFAKEEQMGGGTFDQQGGGWDQHQQQQQWGGDQQWGAPQQQQQQWGAQPAPGQAWTTTTTQWTGAGAPPQGFGAPAW